MLKIFFEKFWTNKINKNKSLKFKIINFCNSQVINLHALEAEIFKAGLARFFCETKHEKTLMNFRNGNRVLLLFKHRKKKTMRD